MESSDKAVHGTRPLTSHVDAVMPADLVVLTVPVGAMGIAVDLTPDDWGEHRICSGCRLLLRARPGGRR